MVAEGIGLASGKDLTIDGISSPEVCISAPGERERERESECVCVCVCVKKRSHLEIGCQREREPPFITTLSSYVTKGSHEIYLNFF
jgi:hypothetical protein